MRPQQIHCAHAMVLGRILKTRNQMRVAIQSGCVSKILALQRWSKNDFSPEFQNLKMHSFPIMYNTMGSKLDGLAVRDHFLPKNGLKTAILGLTILDRLTSEGAGTQIFEAIANFSMCFEKFGTLSSKWAMGKASSFNIAQTTGRYFFGRGGHEKMQKNEFFRKTLAPEKFIIENFFQHRTMWKLTSGRFRKCISYEAYGDFYASYHRSKSTHGWKSESVTIIMRCPKKKTRPQFWVLGSEIESAWNQHGCFNADSISSRNSQNCGRVFFLLRLIIIVTLSLFQPCVDFERW